MVSQITHIALTGPDEAVIAEVREPSFGTPDQGPEIVLSLGPHLALHISPEMNRRMIDAQVEADALFTTEQGRPVYTCATGPVPYLPMWHPV